jgi:hypothetical protein
MPVFQSLFSRFQTLIAVLILVPGLSFAAPKAKSTSKAADPKNNEATIGAAFGQTSSIPEALKGHLSIFGMFDMADQFEISGGTKADSERTFVLGANFEFDQFNPGLALQVGGTYDVSREVKNSGGLKVSEWTGYGEVTAKVSPKVKLMGGMNYNLPSLSNAGAGASVKGKIGFQMGATFQFAPQLAFDARWRQLEMEVSANNGQGGSNSTGAKISGFMLGGRFIF